ncbi:MAG: DNA adenine methylase [Campylobacteraceae bacterium]|nr:DNA adenine methylase [Campylobacteraceae bacterium]
MTALMQPKLIKEIRLSPILKWAGGKEQELKYIHTSMPKKIKNYYEPFIGGGAVYFSLQAKQMFINDKSHELIHLYNVIKKQDKDFFNVVDEIIHNWELLEKIVETNKEIFIKTYLDFSQEKVTTQTVDNWLSSFILLHSKEFNGMFSTSFNVNIDNFLKEIKKNFKSKIKRMTKIEKERGKLPEKDILDNIEASFKSAFYMHFRHLYNHIKEYNISHSFAVAIFFFIRNFAYSGMFRYNKNGGFNVPYGGIGYNRKNLSKKVEYLKSSELVAHLQITTIDNLDFQDFFKKNKPKKDDFIFLDPPYDSKFSTYAKNKFTQEDQKRLASYLINDCKANWMMVIKNTDFIYSLYNQENIYMSSFDKKYLVSFQNRNDKNAEHLIITNYKI